MSIPRLFDVHTHVQFHAFKNDADLVIQRALDVGVWMINVGTQKNTSEDAVKFAELYNEGVYAAVGLHPIHTERSYHDLAELGHVPQELGITSLYSQVYKDVVRGFAGWGEEFDYEYYKNLALRPKTVAIGECGLDYYRIMNKELGILKQKKAFIGQIELALELKKPLMVHCRNAFGDLIKILNSYFATHNSANPGVIHFFSGTKDDAKELLGLGFSFSFGGVITFARDYDEAIRYVPLERILLETDAPYVAPIPHRGKRNEPVYVVEAAKKIAELKGISLDEVASKTTANARRLFGLSPHLPEYHVVLPQG